MLTNLIPRREDLFFPLQKEFDKLFDEFFGSKRFPSLLNSIKSHSGYPKLDVLIADGKYKIEAAVPGVNPDDLKVEILPQGNGERCLRISGRINQEYQYSNDTDYHHRELSRSRFQRVVTLPKEVTGDPEAVIRNGMLTLSWELPKTLPDEETRVIPLKKE